jgi:hypothetical protein
VPPEEGDAARLLPCNGFRRVADAGLTLIPLDGKAPTRHRERRTGLAARNQIYTLEVMGPLLKKLKVLFQDVPLWAVDPQSVAAMRINFDKCLVSEASLF